MNTAHENPMILKVEIPDRALAQSLLENWSAQPGISINILRGRVASDKTRLELEVRGNAPNVARIVRQSAPWNVARRFLNPVPAGASA